MSTHIKSMTEGKPYKLIFAFAMPLMLGNVFQQMYTVMDTLIVGRSLGVNALAALGATDWTIWLVLGIITGFTQGFSILMSQNFGAEKYDELRKAIGCSCILAVIWSVLLLIFSFLAAKPILLFLQTPEEIIPSSLSYMYMLFAGIPFIMMYNLFASILRALGDGQTPLRAMIVASIANILLDLLFVIVFKMGVMGAALGTILAQLLAGLFCFFAIRKIEILHLRREDFALDIPLIKKLMLLGVPVAFQNGVISIGGMVVQYVINRYGVIFIAGFTATNKLYGILEMAAISYGFAMTTYVGQNLGAGLISRIKKGMHNAVGISLITSLLIGAAMLLFGKYIVGAFITGVPAEAEAATAIAYHYLSIMSVMLFTLYLLHIYRSGLQGMGDTIMPMVSGIAEFVMRIGAALLLPIFMGQDGIFYAEILAWIGADVILISSYYYRIHKYQQAK